jgi:hypothetical protein
MKTEAEQYIAISDVLKIELPTLYELTKKLVRTCLENFVELHSRWEMMWAQKLRPFIENPDQVFHSSSSDVHMEISDEFLQFFEPIENELSALNLTARTIVEDIDTNFLVMPQPSFADEPSSRPSLGNGRRHERSARSSSEQPSRPDPSRTTPALSSLGTPQTGNTSRHSDRILSPPPSNSYGFGGSQEYLSSPYHDHSANHSPGPATPHHPPSGLQTPASQYDQRSNPNHQYYQSRWAEQGAAMAGVSSSDWMSNQSRLQQQADDPEQYYHQHSRENSASTANGNYSIFNSALPADIAEDEDSRADVAPVGFGEGDEPNVLFVVASLFEFHIDTNRREAGFPYLKYVAGEVFDILAQRGELWLARNQDDPHKILGWIWEKHFAMLPLS